MAIAVDYAGADTGNGLDFGSQTSPADGVIMGCTISGSGNSDIQWDGTDLDTQLTLDTNVYNSRDFESRIETGVSTATKNLTGDGAASTIGLAAILSGCTGTYQSLYGNPAGAATPSITSYIGGKTIIMTVRRGSYADVSITSGGENLTTEASITFPAFENFYMRIFSCDTTATTLALSFTSVAYEIVSLQAFAAEDFDDWTESIVGVASIEQDDTYSKNLGHSAKLVNGSSPDLAKMTQEVTVEEGIQYTVSGWVYGDYKVTITGDTNTDNATGSAASWYEFSADIVADDTTLTVQLEPYTWGDTAYFDGLELTAQYPANYEHIKFVGTLHKIYPSSGQFDDPLTECEAHDWMGYLTKQELGIQAIQSDKRADEALTTCLTEFPNQPEDTDFDTGVETFEMVFAGDSETSSMASQFAKYARNEQGRIFTRGDGTLVFEKQGARAANTTSAFTLDGTMENLEVSYNVSNLYNIVSLNMRTTETDAAATTELFTVGKGILIEAGETLNMICKFTDPDTGMAVAGTDVVDPETADDFHFGTTQSAADDDKHADIVWATSPVIGGSSVSISMENDSVVDGYLNELTILGKRITEYSKISIEKRNADSIDQVGNRRYSNRLDLIEDAGTAEDIVDGILAKYAPSHIDRCRVTVLANMDSDVAAQLIIAEPSTRFTAIESVTGIEKDLYINNIRYQQSDTLLWVTIEAEEV